MWNPFRSVKLSAVPMTAETPTASGPENDPSYRAALEQSQLRSLLARTQITMLHEGLANKALNQLRGHHVSST